MARILGVSRSGYYSRCRRGCPKDKWYRVRKAVERIWLESDKRFGARSIKRFLPDEFIGATLYRMQKCMCEPGIRGCAPFTSKRTAIPDKSAKVRPGLIRRDFASPIPTYKLVDGIAYLRTGQGWLYLASAIDLNTRTVVGWPPSKSMAADMVISALANAKIRGYVAENAIFHSDRESRYTSKASAERAQNNQVRSSVGRTGSCHDNAVAESFLLH